MSKVDELVINYAIYEDAVEYLGTTEVTLQDLEYMTEELSGAGIAGNIEEIIIGHLNAMSTTFNFRTVTAAAVKLMEPRVHRIDLRVAQQRMNLFPATVSRCLWFSAASILLKVKIMIS